MFPQSFLPKSAQRLILRRFIDQDLERFLDYRQDTQVEAIRTILAFIYRSPYSARNCFFFHYDLRVDYYKL